MFNVLFHRIVLSNGIALHVNTQETMDYVYKEIMSLWKAFNQKPFLGIDCEAMAKAGSGATAPTQSQ